MTFSSQVKNEIVRSRLKNDVCRKMEFYGTLFVSGCFFIAKNTGILIKTENEQVAQHFFALLKARFPFEVVLEEKQQEHRKVSLFEIRISGPEVLGHMKEIGYIRTDDTGMHIAEGLPEMDREDEEQVRAFVRGCFLGAGSCTDPSDSYSAEIVCPTRPLAVQIADILNAYFLNARVAERRQKYVVYMRDGDSVTGFLAFIGSHSSALGLENIRAEKETRNYVNRATNCENANIDKVVTASLNQKAAIENIIAHGYYTSLSRALQQAADLRLEYPDATLNELAELASIKKSGMNHRLARLIDISESIDKGLV